MSADIPRWMYSDPALAYERIEATEINYDRRAIDMGQKLKSVSEKVQRDMHQWADWATRPQFWENLSITPFCRLLGMSFGKGAPDFKLDPQSMAIHKAVMGLDAKYQIVVAAYYVAGIWHEDNPGLFNGRGISRATYYRRLEAGTVMAHNNAMRILKTRL